MDIIQFEWDDNKNAINKRSTKYHLKKLKPYSMMRKP